jgi:hypothetical protein
MIPRLRNVSRCPCGPVADRQCEAALVRESHRRRYLNNVAAALVHDELRRRDPMTLQFTPPVLLTYGGGGSAAYCLRPENVAPDAVARVCLVAGPRPVGAPALDDRTALSASQDRTRPRSFRRPNVSRLAAPHGDQRARLRVSSDGTHARAGRPALTFPALRAMVQEVFTELLFASRPTYVKWLQDAHAKHQLRTKQSRIRVRR